MLRLLPVAWRIGGGFGCTAIVDRIGASFGKHVETMTIVRNSGMKGRALVQWRRYLFATTQDIQAEGTTLDRDREIQR